MTLLSNVSHLTWLGHISTVSSIICYKVPLFIWGLFDFLNAVYADLYSDVCRRISFKLGMMIWTASMILDDFDLHSRSQLYEKSKTLVSIFWEILPSIWLKFSIQPQPNGLLKLVVNLFCTSNIQGRDLCLHDFIKYAINIVHCWDTCKPIYFKLGMMLHTTKLYSLISVGINSLFTQGHRRARTCVVILLKSCIKRLIRS